MILRFKLLYFAVNIKLFLNKKTFRKYYEQIGRKKQGSAVHDETYSRFLNTIIFILRMNCLEKTILFIYYLRIIGEKYTVYFTITRNGQGHSWVEYAGQYNPTQPLNDENRKFAIPFK